MNYSRRILQSIGRQEVIEAISRHRACVITHARDRLLWAKVQLTTFSTYRCRLISCLLNILGPHTGQLRSLQVLAGLMAGKCPCNATQSLVEALFALWQMDNDTFFLQVDCSRDLSQHQHKVQAQS